MMIEHGAGKLLLPLLLVSLLCVAAAAGGKGQGAIVIRENAPVYAKADGDEVDWKLNRGEAVAGIMGGLQPHWQFDEKNGRVHVAYFRGEEKGMQKGGWMNPTDLARFTYDGSCQANASPLTTKGFSQRWNACFQEARDAKLEELKAKWVQEDAAKADEAPQTAP